MEVKIKVPDSVKVETHNFKVSVTGAKGKLEKDFSSPLFRDYVKILKDGSIVKISSESMKRKIKAEVGCIGAHIKSMIKGVTEGYEYKLKIVYIHFPFTVKVSGNEVHVTNFLGERFVRKAKMVGDTKVEVKGQDIIVTGINKEDVGQTAANLERATVVPARDRRVFQDGIFLVSR